MSPSEVFLAIIEWAAVYMKACHNNYGYLGYPDGLMADHKRKRTKIVFTMTRSVNKFYNR